MTNDAVLIRKIYIPASWYNYERETNATNARFNEKYPWENAKEQKRLAHG